MHDPAFDTPENQTLLAVCARKTIRKSAIIGVIWGCINLALGCFVVRLNPINIGLILLALLMLSAGVTALRRPSLHALWGEAIVSLLLFA